VRDLSQQPSADAGDLRFVQRLQFPGGVAGMRILALDTSTEACSAAILDGTKMLERFALAPQQHARLLMAMVAELLEESGADLSSIELIAVAQGPGSFTGIRIAAGVAQGIAHSNRRQVVGVSTLAAIAQHAMHLTNASRVACAMDARMGQVYWGLFERDAAGLAAPIAGELLVSPGDVTALPDGRWCGAGTGWRKHDALLRSRCAITELPVDPDVLPHAADIAQLALRDAGSAVAPERLKPVYLRDTVAKKTVER
jgi:tRNA threonylcarbamoyladenosine biosynthesis protein TsaB